MTIPLVFSLIGYAVLLGVNIDTQKGIAYMAIFFCTIGVSLLMQGNVISTVLKPLTLMGSDPGISHECHIVCLDSCQYSQP